MIFSVCLLINMSADVGKVMMAGNLRKKLTVHNLSIINKISGAILIAFGIALLYGVIFLRTPDQVRMACFYLLDMKKIITAFFFLIPLICLSQTDVLILQKNGRNIKTYAPGMTIMIHTVYDQWLGGTITDLRNDSIFINNIPFHVHEIDAIRKNFSKLHLQTGGTILIIAGVGVLALNVINGLYTNESAGSWVKPPDGLLPAHLLSQELL